MKWCSGCKTEKEETEFYKNRSRPDGLQNRCKECSTKSSRESYLKHKDKYKERVSRWHRNRNLKRNYGITVETFELMVFEQNNRCVICREDLVIPHVDKALTGEIRALLCGKCKTGITMFGDSVVLLERAASYLQAYAYLNDYLTTYNTKGTLKRPLAIELD